jgi:hypothetical protein
MRKTKQYQFALDNTLRYLYIALRNAGCSLVAIEFKHRGTLWRADTPEEAVALRNQLEKADKVYVREHEEMELLNEFWSPDRFMDVINGVGDLQRRFLLVVYKFPMITSAELVRQMKLDSEVALAGVISGLSKQLKQLDISLNQVLGIEVKWTGKIKTRRFILDDFFRHAALEQNWPEAWEQQQSKGKEDNAATTRKRRVRTI